MKRKIETPGAPAPAPQEAAPAPAPHAEAIARGWHFDETRPAGQQWHLVEG